MAIVNCIYDNAAVVSNEFRKISFNLTNLECRAACAIHVVNNVRGEVDNVFFDSVVAFL